ncbi:tail fiber domain-containing protein [Chitinophaga sp. XS-30]|uniref:tail fiber domain-containing protein n=1 Tax=Chitinophaga sp. XS-30 TaxID=2604421 RepID=UPI0011DDD19D|nr:tail fiber domain-containing protein [Chitinophaga sp. XS-30]QEH43307.1 tail fiber domain-containing protein [Chitinophaga sp. XS-30]
MKKLIRVLFLLLLGQQAYAQHIYQIRADSVRIYNVCDTAELIIENRTRGVNGFLYNKNNGRTEFRRLRLESVGGSQIAISGQDTLDIGALPGIGGIDTIYRSGDNILYLKKGTLHTIYAPLPAFKEIPNGTSYTVGDFPASRITGFNAYSSPDMPAVSDQALTNPASGNSYYAGHVVRNGSAGYQMAVNWDGELTGPKGVFIRNKDDTQTTWGAWRELVFKDYADGKYAAVSSLLISGQAQVHWNNITSRPLSFPTTSDLQAVTDNGAVTTNSMEINPSSAAFRAFSIKRLVNGVTASAQIANNNNTSLSWTPDISAPLATYRVDIGTGTLKYYNNGSHVDIWRSDNHVAGSAFNPDLSGARVLQGIMSNASGHIVGINTRVLTPGDIGAPITSNISQGDFNTSYTAIGTAFQANIVGLYNGGSIPLNSPNSALALAGAVINAKYDINYGFQLGNTSSTSNYLFFRGRAGGTFGPWVQLADRDWVTSNFAASGGAGNYIQSQNASTQSSSNFWISGEGRSSGQFRVQKNGLNILSGSFLLSNSDLSRGANIQLNGDTNPGLATWIHNGSTWVKRFELFATGTFHFPNIMAGNGSEITLAAPHLRLGGNVAQKLSFDREGAIYIKANGTAGYFNFITGGAADSEASSALTIAANKNATFRGKTLMPVQSGIMGNNTGAANLAYFSFYENDGSTRKGYVGDGGVGNQEVQLVADVDNLLLQSTIADIKLNAVGEVVLTNNTKNHLSFNTAGIDVPAFTARSAGAKIVLYPELTASATDYAIGIESGYQWYSVPLNSTIRGFKWYGGTTAIARLDGTGNFSARSLTSNNGTVNSYLTYSASGNAGVAGTSTAHPFALYTSGIERMRANTGGNILIGTTVDNFTDKLQVNGSVSATGSMTATSFYQTSLRELKMNIHPFTGSAISILARAAVKTFQFKADSTGKTNIGFIADEVPDEIAIPERKGVDQASIVALLVKSIQELKLENEALRKDNMMLQQRMEAFEVRMEKILRHQNK